MKILIIGSAFFDSYTQSFYNTLKQKGIYSDVLDIAEVFGVKQNSKIYKYLYLINYEVNKLLKINLTESRILSLIKKNPYDCLMITAPHLITPESIQEIRSQNKDLIIVSIYGDALVNFGRQYFIHSNYDYYFFKDKFIVDRLRNKAGLNAYYLPQCFDPYIHKCNTLTESDKHKYGCDLTTAGNMYYYKAKMLEKLIEYDMKIWGNFAPWIDSPLKKKWTREYVSGEKKAIVYKAAKICLNLNHYAEIRGVNKRTFEICGCGGFQLTDDSEGLRDVFEPGKEVAVFEDLADLKEKVEYYLKKPDERIKISEAGYKRAKNEHTFEHRIDKMFEIMNLKIS
jgi:spore maturation protein CgeB